MADDDAHRDEQDGDGDNEKFVERKVLVNPNVIENYWQKRQRPSLLFQEVEAPKAAYERLSIYSKL